MTVYEIAEKATLDKARELKCLIDRVTARDRELMRATVDAVLIAVENECRKRADACLAQAKALCGGYPILADQDKLAAAINRHMAEWCVEQRNGEAQEA